MSISHRTRIFAIVTSIGLVSAACGDNAATNRITSPAPAERGTVNISVTTSGGDPDLDGYLAVVETKSRAISSNDRTTLEAIAGTRTVSLARVANNCQVSPGITTSVTVPAGGSVDVAFAVDCATTGILITTRTTGVDIPSGFEIVVVAARSGPIEANGSLQVSRMPPGLHGVVLKFLPGHCTAAGGPVPVVSANVLNRTVTPVAFDIVCGPIERKDKIAYVEMSYFGGDEKGEIMLANPDGSGKVGLAYGTGPAWSPDRRRVAFSTFECDYYGESCTGGLTIMDADTRAFTKPANGESAVTPAWSPGGDEIAFVRPGTNDRQLHVMKADGSSLVGLVMPGTRQVRDPSWSPDGRRLAVTCLFSPTIREICVINRDGTGMVRLANSSSNMSDPAWSPDGSSIAFTIFTPNVGPTIALMKPDGTGVVSLGEGFDPAWSSDGRKLVYSRSNGVFTMEANGSNPRQILAGSYLFTPAWRP